MTPVNDSGGGQAFRWQRDSQNHWLGYFGRVVVRLSLDAKNHLRWSAPVSLATEVATALPTYFQVEAQRPELVDTLPWRSDAHLARCLAAFPGLRILRQPFGETLLGFLCSATKQIVKIKQMIALIAARHFRARYIHRTAIFLAGQPGWLEETEQLPYAEAKERLCSLPGVGEKVADCVLLFGAGRLEAFPVDVWIIKAMVARYGLDGWKPAQIAHFGRVHFGPLAGLAQQYLFAWERRFGRTPARASE